jgi:hypothetical protein
MTRGRKTAGLILMLLVSGGTPGSGQSTGDQRDRPPVISLADELKTYYDISTLPAYRNSTIVAQTSSYDRTGGNDDGFSGKYSYIRRNADSSLVLFDMDGPGVVNRIWTPTPTADTLDLYIDDTLRPALSIRYTDLFSGRVFPFVQPLCGNRLGGYYCYFPILFQKKCRVVSRGKKEQFHQIQYRLYPPGSIVKNFSSKLDAEEKEALDKIIACWSAPPGSMQNGDASGSPEILTHSTTLEIRPGETKTLFSLARGGRITGMVFDLLNGHAWPSRDIDIKISWDSEKDPAVYCPVADFFGYAFGAPSMQSLLLGSVNQKHYCYFPMPFDSRATVQLIYRNAGGSDAPVRLQAGISYTTSKRDPEKEGKFYACWNSKKIMEKNGPYILLHTKGRGHYVGTLLQAQGLRPGMTYFFEADDSTAVDDAFRIHGTGSEDYFNGGWYALPDRWDRALSLPLHGALCYSLPFCQTGGYRLYLADKISFEKNIFQSMETGPVEHAFPLRYTSLALYYCSDPVSTYLKPDNALTRPYVPDTLMIYPQLMHFEASGKVDIRSFWGYDTGGESYIFQVNDASRLKIALDEIPAGKYKVFADLVRLPEGCRFSLWQEQNQVSDWIATDHSTRERVRQYDLGVLEIRGDRPSVSIAFQTGPGQNSLLLNRFILVKQ